MAICLVTSQMFTFGITELLKDQGININTKLISTQKLTCNNKMECADAMHQTHFALPLAARSSLLVIVFQADNFL